MTYFLKTKHFISRHVILLDYLSLFVGMGRGGVTVLVSGSSGSARPVGGEAKKSLQQRGIMSQI